MRTDTNAGKSGVLVTLIVSIGIFLIACGPPMIVTNSGPESGQSPSTDRTKGTGTDASQPDPAAAEVAVRIKDFVFEPAEVTVAPGTRITWTNEDEAPHTATSNDDKFNSGGLDTGDKYSFVFSEKGEFPYICALHPHKKGLIKVK
jgi:plastocyanin